MKVIVGGLHIGRTSDRFTATSKTCPVAKAIQSATGDATASVLYGVAYVRGRECLLPGEVVRYINHWDNTGEMEPFEFDLQI